MSDSDTFPNRHLYEDEDAITSAINYLKINDPENANRDYAIGFLKFMHRFAFHAEKVKDFNYDEIFEEFKKSETK